MKPRNPENTRRFGGGGRSIRLLTSNGVDQTGLNLRGGEEDEKKVDTKETGRIVKSLKFPHRRERE